VPNRSCTGGVIQLNTDVWGAPLSGVLGHPKWVWWHAPHLIQDIWRWHVCILIYTGGYGGGGVNAGMSGRNWTL
jgi:hypothetical protein